MGSVALKDCCGLLFKDFVELRTDRWSWLLVKKRFMFEVEQGKFDPDKL